MIVFWFLNFALVVGVSGRISSKYLEGFPTGFLGDCPGSTKPAIITRKSLNDLTISVQGPGNIMTARVVPYNYYQMDQLAKDRDIDFTKKTFMYVGGFLDSTSWPISWTLGKLYKDLGYNVLLLDTLKFTARDYPVAVRYMRPVGLHVAEMLSNLTSYGLDPKNLELVGLSLGGQTMSFIAKSYRDITGVNISTLVGLDPSGPCFRHLGPEDRLDPSDADFVLTIATNIDGFGIAAPVGHVTFYVNGGEYQPGDVWWIPCLIQCSHLRSLTLWLSALQNPKSFIGMQCDSVQQARDKNCYKRKPFVTNTLDLYTDRNKQGIYFLATSNSFPYYLKEKGLQKKYDYVTWQLKTLNRDNFIKS